MPCKQMGGWWAIQEHGWNSVRRGVECSKEEVSMCISLLLAMGREKET